MKTVFSSNSACAHVWASGAQSEGRANNVSFRDGIFYSYATPIARIVQGADGARVALVSDESHSSTTVRHYSEVWRAWRGNGEDFRVPFIGASGGMHRENSYAPDHAGNLKNYLAQYADFKLRATRAQSRYYNPLETLSELAETVAKYSAAFGLLAPIFNPQADADEIQAFRDAREARRNTPAAIAKRERDRASRARRAEAKAEAARVAREIERAAWEAAEPERAAARAKADAEWEAGAPAREAARLERIAAMEAARVAREINRPARIAAWRAGEPGARLEFDDFAPEAGALLRRVGETVETSRRAEVPLAHAARLFQLVARCRAQGREFRPNGHAVRVGHFTVDVIDSAGNLSAGCHYIAWPEIEAFAAGQGWTLDAPGSPEVTPADTLAPGAR